MWSNLPRINNPCKESWQKMKPKITKDKADLFQIPLERVIDQDHPLVQLSREFDWPWVDWQKSRVGSEAKLCSQE